MADDIVVFKRPISSENEKVKAGLYPMPEYLKKKFKTGLYLFWIEADEPHRVAGYKKVVPCCTMNNSCKIARVKWSKKFLSEYPHKTDAMKRMTPNEQNGK